MIVTACRIAFPRDNSGRDDTVAMVDYSFCYFRVVRGSIPRPLQIDAAIVSQAGMALFRMVSHVSSFHIFSGSIPLPAPKRRDAASGQSSPELCGLNFYVRYMTRYAYEDTLLTLGAVLLHSG